MKSIPIRILIGLTITLIIGGTVLFRIVEEWSWVNSYYFTVITLTTVGYGDFVPKTDIGKIITTVFIMAGLGIIAAALQRFGSYAISHEQRRVERNEEKTGALKAKKYETK